MTGRLTAGPDRLLHEEVLAPQFDREVDSLLPHYVLIEKALLVEYHRMGLLSGAEAAAVASALGDLMPEQLRAEPDANFSDISFAVERYVLDRLPTLPPAWHVDRSRNDQQACAQLMYGRDELLRLGGELVRCAHAAHRLAGGYRDDPMPGYTHLQAAQVITPAFFLAALGEHLLRSAHSLLRCYDSINRSPLGSGAMAGQELDWDRDRLAALLGFDGIEPHALVGVASRAWSLDIAADCSTAGVGIARFVTDLMAWASSEYQFIELPDGMAGISSAMPQKKNYPILERIRGRLARPTTAYLELAMAQRSAPFSNTVESGKEGAAAFPALTAAFGSAIRLLTAVLDNLSFDRRRLRAACEREYLGGFTLANRLTLDAAVPWRRAQVIAGEYILAAQRAGGAPADTRPDLLAAVAERNGHRLAAPERVLAGVFDPDASLDRKVSAGSSRPAAVSDLLTRQAADLERLTVEWDNRRTRRAGLTDGLDRALPSDGAVAAAGDSLGRAR